MTTKGGRGAAGSGRWRTFMGPSAMEESSIGLGACRVEPRRRIGHPASGKPQNRQRRHTLEKSRNPGIRSLNAFSSAFNLFKQRIQRGIVNGNPVNLETLVQCDQMWRRIEPCFQPCMLQHRGYQRRNRALPIRSRHMNNCQPLFRVVQFCKQSTRRRKPRLNAK